MPSQHPRLSPPRRPIPFWLRLLGDLLRESEYPSHSIKGPCPRVDTNLLTSRYHSEEVSSCADERLLVLVAFMGAGFVHAHQGYAPATAHLFHLAMGS